MPKFRTVLLAGALGAAASYFFDPERGKGRRSRARDQLGALLRSGRRNVEGTAMQVTDRARGAVAEVQHARSERAQDDLTVLSRVQSEVMGRPDFPKGRVNADVVDGRLTLRGELDSEEQIRDLVQAASRVSGVVEVVNLLHLPGTPPPNEAESQQP
jgi:osmotically-inducible protein OsmY